MSEQNWYKTDNVAKVFLASFNRRDTRTMRVSCTLTEPVNPELLQQALIYALEDRPQFAVRIRRGFFWHYIEGTDAMPVVTQERGRPCPILYGHEYGGVLHFSVTYFKNRINLDMFHALSDGTGILDFLYVILGEYMKLAHPDEAGDLKMGSGASAADLTQNSFSQYYGQTSKGAQIPVTKSVKAYRHPGRKLPYDQLQFMEICMDSSEVIKRSKAMGVGLTSYIGAIFVLGMQKDMPALMRKLPITVSIPVNLRQIFPSETSRNFFNSINVRFTYDPEATVESIAKSFDEQLKEGMKPELIAQQMDAYEKIERYFFIRMVPLAIKQPVVRRFSKLENRRISFVLSNLGRLKVDERIDPFVESFSAFCSHSEMFTTVFSYGDTLKLGVSSAYSDTRMLKNFVRYLTEDGVEVTVNATEVLRS